MPDLKNALENCAKEPIHIPGYIQSHGFLLVINPQTLTILQASANVIDFLPFTAEDLYQKHLNELPIAGLREIVTLCNLHGTFDNLNPYKIKIKKNNQHVAYNLLLHLWNGSLLLEFEPAAAVDEIVESNTVLSGLISILNTNAKVSNVLDNVAAHVKLITGYDKVMIYRFAEDFHGEVIAEALNAGDTNSYFGLHFPASDIPAQARALYVRNKVRIIPNVRSTPSLLHPLLIDNQPTNLENSVLRAVSPVHIQYLKNMGVGASFSISIIIDEKLWGLIACHSYEPKFIPFELRQTCQMIGFILSCHLQNELVETSKQYEREMVAREKSLIDNITDHWSIPLGLCNRSVNMMAIADCTGAALFYNNELYIMGNAPEKEKLIELINWLSSEQHVDYFYQTSQLPLVYEPAKQYAGHVSGLMSICLSRYLKEYLLWFKPEKKQTVNWGGMPEKVVEYDELGNLQPRNSFASWQQEVIYTSDSWNNTDITVVLKLKDDLAEIISYQSNEIRRLNEKLLTANTELDAFGYTISHDLKNPLTAIQGYSQLLIETHRDKPETHTFVIGERILEKTKQINQMIDDIINYTKSTREPVARAELNTSILLNDIIEEFDSNCVNKPVFFLRETPNLIGNHTMTRQIFQNIISNAVKYSSGENKIPVVTIEGWKDDKQVIFSIKDNGIGFDMKDATRVFEIFKRLHSGEYAGHGVGLSIVKRLVERLDGKIWVESQRGIGSTFFVAFPAEE